MIFKCILDYMDSKEYKYRDVANTYIILNAEYPDVGIIRVRFVEIEPYRFPDFYRRNLSFSDPDLFKKLDELYQLSFLSLKDRQNDDQYDN